MELFLAKSSNTEPVDTLVTDQKLPTKPYLKNRTNNTSNVAIRGQPMASLSIDGKERVCLAQISATLLKKFSYNEIHNRRVALGINCIQCTPEQLEMLREAGAMPISSRRCGMITKKEAERLVKSFLDVNKPPSLPDSFTFKVQHKCAYGCHGSFFPSRYNSSRAKCIRCSDCNAFYSPNKFIFHSHEISTAKYVQTGTVNFNSWRKHIVLINLNNDEDLNNAWEDVKSIFNSGKRRRTNTSGNSNILSSGNVYSDLSNTGSESNLNYSFEHECENSNSEGSCKKLKFDAKTENDDVKEEEVISEKNEDLDHTNSFKSLPQTTPCSTGVSPAKFLAPPMTSFSPAFLNYLSLSPFYQNTMVYGGGPFQMAKYLPALLELNTNAFLNYQNYLKQENSTSTATNFLENSKVLKFGSSTAAENLSRPGFKSEQETKNSTINNFSILEYQQQLLSLLNKNTVNNFNSALAHFLEKHNLQSVKPTNYDCMNKEKMNILISSPETHFNTSEKKGKTL